MCFEFICKQKTFRKELYLNDVNLLGGSGSPLPPCHAKSLFGLPPSPRSWEITFYLAPLVFKNYFFTLSPLLIILGKTLLFTYPPLKFIRRPTKERHKKIAPFLWALSKGGGGGFNRDPKVLRYFCFPLFWPPFGHIMGGEGEGVHHIPKVLRHFLPKFWEFWAFKKLPLGCPKWAQNKNYLTMSKKREGGSRPLLEYGKIAISPFFDGSRNKNIDATIPFGPEIRCLLYVGFFLHTLKTHK